MRKNWFFAALAVLLLGVSLQAQERQWVDIVYLKSGGQFVGEILSYEQGVKVVLQKNDGSEVEIPDADIKKIVQGVQPESAVFEKPGIQRQIVRAKMKGLYNTTLLSFAMGSGNRNGLALGAGFSNITGYQFGHFGAGIGVGVDNYARRGETIYPLFAELRFFIPSKKGKEGNYYFSAAGGYGLAFKRENLNITEATGGYMAHPAFGYRVATSEGLDVNLDLGLKIQKAEFTRTLFNGDVEIRDLLYRRIVVRVGLTLWK